MAELGKIIVAFGEEHVERLTGLTPAQLRYWDRTGFFALSHAEESRNSAYGRIYSFKDVVALRTLGLLRRQHNVPLQHLRRVAERLRHLEDDLWSKTTLYVLNRRVIFHEPGSRRLQDAVAHLGGDVAGHLVGKLARLSALQSVGLEAFRPDHYLDVWL